MLSLYNGLNKNRHLIDIHLSHKDLVKNPLKTIQDVYYKLGLKYNNKQEFFVQNNLRESTSQFIKEIIGDEFSLEQFSFNIKEYLRDPIIQKYLKNNQYYLKK